MKVLVVDDSKMIRDMVAECVRSMGHEVVFAENGEQALAYVQGNTVDLALMDVEMPGMNGLEAMRRIKENRPETNFVILTAYDDEEQVYQIDSNETVVGRSSDADFVLNDLYVSRHHARIVRKNGQYQLVERDGDPV